LEEIIVKIARLKMLMVFVILAAFGAAQTVMAEVPKIPLKDGMYIPAGVKFEKFADKDLPVDRITFVSRSKETGKTDAFIIGGDGYYITNVSINGNIYHISGECWGGAAQGMPNGKFNWTINIINQTSFKVISKTDFSEAGKVYSYWKRSLF
jgi:hypothetical protein